MHKNLPRPYTHGSNLILSLTKLGSWIQSLGILFGQGASCACPLSSPCLSASASLSSWSCMLVQWTWLIQPILFPSSPCWWDPEPQIFQQSCLHPSDPSTPPWTCPNLHQLARPCYAQSFAWLPDSPDLASWFQTKVLLRAQLAGLLLRLRPSPP